MPTSRPRSFTSPCPSLALMSLKKFVDFMYSNRCNDDSAFREIGNLSPRLALGALWLVDHFKIPDLEQHVLEVLRRSAANADSADVFLETATELSQGHWEDALVQLASKGLEIMPAGACNTLPLKLIESLLDKCPNEARARTVVPYLQAREKEGRLDVQHFRRLVIRLLQCDDDLDAENAWFLLAIARGLGDTEMEERCRQKKVIGFWGQCLKDIAKLPNLKHEQATWKISQLVSPGMAVSGDRLSVAYTSGSDWNSALLEPHFDSAVGSAYVEWSLDQTDKNCLVVLGVTTLDEAPYGWDDGCNSPESRLFNCGDSSLRPIGIGPASWVKHYRKLSQGDLVGLLVEGGRAWVYVNGERVGGGPMAESLPRRLRFMAATLLTDTRLRLVAGARPPRVS